MVYLLVVCVSFFKKKNIKIIEEKCPSKVKAIWQLVWHVVNYYYCVGFGD